MNYQDFTFWFRRISEDRFAVIDRESKETVGVIVDTEYLYLQPEKDDEMTHRIGRDFSIYKGRPEYCVGLKMMSDGLDTLKEFYVTLITGVIMIRAELAGLDPDSETVTKSIAKVVDMLNSSDFFTAPASTRFHESFPGGLLYHTMKVYNQIVDLHKLEKFKNVVYMSMTLVALVHDWCKIGLYKPYKRNVKNNETGRWEQVDAYERGFTYFTHGHQSLDVAQRFFKLTTEEKLAITHHMGHWYCHPAEENALQKSNEDFPLVLMIQFADSLAITNY